jgi:hypothetical protein
VPGEIWPPIVWVSPDVLLPTAPLPGTHICQWDFKVDPNIKTKNGLV